MKSGKASNHFAFLNQTIALAWQARKRGDHPFGAALVRRGEIVIEGGNTVVTEANTIDHAEFKVLYQAQDRFSSKVLSECTLYASTEPCAMCCGAMYWSGVRKLVYAFPAAELGKMTGGEFVVPCRDLLAHTRSKVEISGPFAIEAAREVHAGYWNK